MDDIEALVQRTESRRVAALNQLNQAEQARYGQFFTPSRAAELIASMVRLPNTGALRMLDPGAGVGSLTVALLARLANERPRVRVHVVAQEIDSAVTVALRATLLDCAASLPGMTFNIVNGDFLLDPEAVGGDFDVVIMNPPYAKLPSGSAHRMAMDARGLTGPNLYAAFLGLGVQALRLGGQVVAITPRSFTNGTYFTDFRGFLLREVALDQIHIFESRKTVFADTGVLQENIVFAATRGAKQGPVALSASTGHEDEVTKQTVEFSHIVHPGDGNRYLRIPAALGASEAVDALLGLPSTLADLGLKVSTGRVVDFRHRENIGQPGLDTFPMVYPSNFRNGIIEHPVASAKPQGFRVLAPGDEKLLVPAGNYVMVKRFSSKEERRRIVAGVWMDDGQRPAFDNKTNYLHSGGGGFDRELAVGLSYWLNSTVVDIFFRTFSGHTQENATDLRSMRFPSTDELRELGRAREPELPAQARIDDLIGSLLSFVQVAA